MTSADARPQFTHDLGVHASGGLDADEFLAVTVDGTQNAIALPARHRLDEGTGKAPDHAQKGSEDKVRGVDKEHFAFAFGRLLQPGFPFARVKCKLELTVGLAGKRCGLLERHAHLLHRPATLAFREPDARQRLDAHHGRLGIGHRSGFERADQTLPEWLQRTGGAIVTIFENSGPTPLLILP